MALNVTVEQYLARIGLSEAPSIDLAGLTQLQRAHLSTVPFENLNVYWQTGVRTDTDWSLDKIVNGGRGGWCFEANGAFSWLLEQLGFRVTRLGAAVLLDGPSAQITHLTLEVMLDEPFLVDVGFGDSFINPLRLNSRALQDCGTGQYQFMPSPQGTTLTELDDGLPAARYRFKRISLTLANLEPASQQLYDDPELHWRRWPFATRLIDGGPDRVTLLADRLKFRRDGEWTETPVAPEDWDAALNEWFDMTPPAASERSK